MPDFLVNAAIAGVLLSMICGPIGSVILWNKLTYLGDSVAHASVLGVVLSLILKINIFLGGFAITIFILSIFINYYSNKHRVEIILFIFSSMCFSLGLMINSSINLGNINLETILFGDILVINDAELIMIACYVAVSLGWLAKNWRDILFVSIDEDIATTRGVNVKLLKAKFIVIIVSIVLFFAKIVGILLITSLMIIPAAAARIISKSPKSMIFYAVIFGIISNILGLYFSFIYDTASGPSIVFFSSLIFSLTSILKQKKRIFIKKKPKIT